MTKDSQTRGTVRTAIAIVLLAIMLFPIYWMVNTSFQASGQHAERQPSSPPTRAWTATETALRDQGRNLVTSLLIASGTVVITLLVATPCAYALAQFRFRWISGRCWLILITQMIPGIVIANALYTVYESIGLLDSIPGLIFANATAAVPFGDLDHAVVHARRAAVDRGGGPGRRGRVCSARSSRSWCRSAATR